MALFFCFGQINVREKILENPTFFLYYPKYMENKKIDQLQKNAETLPIEFVQPANSIKDLIQLIIVIIAGMIPVALNIYLKKELKPVIKIVAPEDIKSGAIVLAEEEEKFSQRFGEFWNEQKNEKKKDQPKDKPWIKKR